MVISNMLLGPSILIEHYIRFGNIKYFNATVLILLGADIDMVTYEHIIR